MQLGCAVDEDGDFCDHDGKRLEILPEDMQDVVRQIIGKGISKPSLEFLLSSSSSL